jgi:antitoxin HicB
LIPAEEGGFIVNFPDLPNGWSQGETRDEALAQAEDLLEEIILGRMAHNEDVLRPSPRKGRPVVALPALTAAKFEAYRAMRAAGLNKRRLAERLGWQPSQVTPSVRRSSCFAPRPDRGGPQRSRTAPGGDERNCGTLAQNACSGCRKAMSEPARPPPPPRSDLSGLSVLGRFNSLIVDFVSLFVGFISLFGRLGNLPADVSQYQLLAGTNSTAGRPGIGLYALSSRRPGNPIHGARLSQQAIQPVAKVERLARAEVVGRISRSNISAADWRGAGAVGGWAHVSEPRAGNWRGGGDIAIRGTWSTWFSRPSTSSRRIRAGPWRSCS